MAAQYKNYEYGDNAKVLKSVVGPTPKAPVADTAFKKDMAAVGGSIIGGVRNKLSQLQGVKNAISAGVTDKVNRIGRYFGGATTLDMKKEKEGLDRALFSNTFRPSSLVGSSQKLGDVQVPNGNPQTIGFSPNPDAQFERLGAGPRPGAQLGPGLTITQNRFGETGLFGSNGQRVDPSQTRLSGGNLGGTPLPAGQQTTFNRISVPMPGGAAAPAGGAPAQPGASGFTGTTNYTNLFANDAKIDAMRLANAKNDYRIGEGNPRFFTGPGEPGAGTYAPGSATAQFQDRRNLVQTQLDEYNRRNPLASNASVGEIIAHQANTKSMRDEIKHLDEQVFGRTDLANKIMTALIGKDATLQSQALENKGKMDVQGLENQGTFDVRKMMETEEGRRHLQTLLFGGAGKSGKDPLADADIDFRKSSGLEMLKYMKENGATQDELSAFASDYSLKNFGRPRNEKEEDQKRISGI